MNHYFNYYLLAFAITFALFCWQKYRRNLKLKHFRANLEKGQLVMIDYRNQLHDAEIERIHNDVELVFVWFPELGFFTYVEPSIIFPYDYK